MRAAGIDRFGVFAQLSLPDDAGMVLAALLQVVRGGNESWFGRELSVGVADRWVVLCHAWIGSLT